MGGCTGRSVGVCTGRSVGVCTGRSVGVCDTHAMVLEGLDPLYIYQFDFSVTVSFVTG